MNELEQILFEKAWEKEKQYKDALSRWGERDLSTCAYWTAFAPLHDVIERAGLGLEYHRWVAKQTTKDEP